MIRELRKELAWEKNEHAALVRDFEKGNDELAQRIHSQPQVDGETWQFRGDSREWISFPASLNVFIMFSFLLPFPNMVLREPEVFYVALILFSREQRTVRTKNSWPNFEKAMNVSRLS
jgi:hypothetical protein